jgi:hypothetical protein
MTKFLYREGDFKAWAVVGTARKPLVYPTHRIRDDQAERIRWTKETLEAALWASETIQTLKFKGQIEIVIEDNPNSEKGGVLG